MTFTLTYNDQTFTAEVIINSFSKTEVYWNSLKQADNSARFTCVFTIELANFLKTNINNNILVTVEEEGTPYFYGYVRKSITFSKTQINQPIALEVVSPSFFLDKEITDKKAYIEKDLHHVVSDILSLAGIENVGDLSALAGIDTKFIAVTEGTYKEILSQMLYEFGFCWDFDNTGVFTVYPLFNVPDNSEITNEFNGANCLDQITVRAKDYAHDGVKASFRKIEKKFDLIFSDTTKEEKKGTGKCYRPVKPHGYLNDKQWQYLDVDSKFGEVVYIKNHLSEVFVENWDLEFYVNEIDLNPDSPNYQKHLFNQLCFSAYNNNSSKTYAFTQIDIKSDVYVANAQDEANTFGSKNNEEVTLKYVCLEDQAKAFAKKVTEWYRYATSEITLNSKTNYPLGSFVKVTDYGIGTYYGRIIKKVHSLTSDKITYLIETVGEYTPAEITTKETPVAGNINYGSLDSVLDQANTHTDEAIASAQMKASPIYSAVFNATVLKKGNDGAYSPAEVTARGRALTGDDQEEAYEGVWNVYVNNQTTACISFSNVELSLSVDDLMNAAGVDELTSVRVDFLAGNEITLIDSQIIPVLTGSAAYTVILDNPFQTYEADENGRIGERTVTAKARVYYGLQEMEYLAEDGWEYGAIVAPEGFNVSVDTQSGEITITALEGTDMAEAGRIEIPVFLHSQTNTEYVIGYVSEARAVVEYYVGYDTKYVGYLTPDENGYYYTYFNFQKLTRTAVKLAQLNTKVEGYWNTLTNDLVVTIAEKETLRILLNSVKAEYQSYTERYSSHTKYNAYANAYTQLNNAVSVILAYDGAYRFTSEAERNSFNQKFSAYYSAKGALDAEIASVSTNYGGLSTINDINRLTPKPTDYFAWVGTDQTVLGDITLRTGLVYAWNGTAWVQDNDNSHMMNTLDYVLNYIKESDDDTIPAISFAKQLTALKVVTDTLSANFATINYLRSEYIEATDMHLKGYSSIDGEVNATRGVFKNVVIENTCKVKGSIGDEEIFNEGSVMTTGKFDYFPRPGTDIIVVYRGYKYNYMGSMGPLVGTDFRPCGMYVISSLRKIISRAGGTIRFETTVQLKTIWQDMAYPIFTKKTREVSGIVESGTEEYFEVQYRSLTEEFGGGMFSHLTMN